MGQAQVACDVSMLAVPHSRPRLTQASTALADHFAIRKTRTSFTGKDLVDTPVDQMTPEQKEAFDKATARQERNHEALERLESTRVEDVPVREPGPQSPTTMANNEARNQHSQETLHREMAYETGMSEELRSRLRPPGPGARPKRPPMMSAEEESPWTGWEVATDNTGSPFQSALLQTSAWGGFAGHRRSVIETSFTDKEPGPTAEQMRDQINKVVETRNVIKAENADMAAQSKLSNLIGENPGDQIEVDFHSHKQDLANEKASQNFRDQQVELMSAEQAKAMKLDALMALQTKMAKYGKKGRPPMISCELPYFGDLKPAKPPPRQTNEHKYLGPEIGYGVEKPLSMTGLPLPGEQPGDIPIAKFPGVQAEMVPDQTMAESPKGPGKEVLGAIPLPALYAAALTPTQFPFGAAGFGKFPKRE
eukprot:CAMPEP_0169300786 /NCGR_PEP_ID=MMETSP1016-20121227/67874_1 /TAXON_ID=342587 /ORGANISM="Karlodinium micrum, Strain CCMP2283" /LENGTH=421 /DNA_ID=CAMNT_0009393297 /DNA_START=9 /DNA_END=1271 /DNA_ORIENTATION=-